MESNVNQIQKVFEYQGGPKVRTVVINEEPWFVALDELESEVKELKPIL